MTIREITALRRSGQLQEALQAAEELYDIKRDNYTAGTLFWCLNDLSRNEADTEALAAIYGRMKELCDFCGYDEYIARSIAYLEKCLDPISAEIKSATEWAKSGRVDSPLLARLRSVAASGGLKSNLYSDYGWLLYYSLKHTPDSNPAMRKQLLFDYLKLELERPSILHSLMLGEAVRIEKNTSTQFQIRNFMRLWGWENFRDEDWEQFKTDNGNVMSSLVEKFIALFAKELKDDHVESPKEFDALVDKALEKFPGSQYMPYYKAISLISKRMNSEALDYYRLLLLKNPTKYYLWHQASALVDDVDMKIALLCKAIGVEKDESFLGRCRLDLARALIQKGMNEYAQHQLSKCVGFYRSKGWKIKQEYYDLQSLLKGVCAANGSSVYAAFAKKADEFAYGAIPSKLAIKISDRLIDDKKHPGKKVMLWTLRTKDNVHYLKKPGKYGLDSNATNGLPLDIKIHEKKIVWVRKSQQNPLDQDWIRKQEGIVRLRTDKNGNAYTFIQGCYVAARLLSGIADGDAVKIIALLRDDGLWQAISIKKLNG